MMRSNVKPILVRNREMIAEPREAHRISFVAIFMAVFFIVGFYVMSKWAIEHFNKPISIVKVEGNFHHLTQQQVATALEPYVETNFLSVDLDRVQQAVSSLPWVSNVTVRRIWPDGVAIKIKEEMAIARWGDSQLLDEEGRVFSLDELNEETSALPILNGPKGHEQDVMKQYQYIGQLLRPLNRRITHLTLAERGAWELQLNDGMKVMLGKDRLMEKIQRFIRLYDAELAQSTVPILVVDVRYSNGIAVRWGSAPTETESTQKSTDVRS